MVDSRERAIDRSFALAFMVVTGALVALAALPLDAERQAILTWSCVALLLPVRLWPRRGWARLLFLTITVFVVLRYLGWRTYATLQFHDPTSYLAAVLLYAAEWHGVLLLLLSGFVNVHPIVRRAAPLPAREVDYPTVDVLITTYDEDPELVRITLVAATAVDYPKDRLRVYLLDDGASEARLQGPDRARAQAARERQAVLRHWCELHGAHYLNRPDNRGAKSGNLNAALARTSGDLVLILDADHVPARDILRQTVGFFAGDERLFLVQTPHFFLNPDPIEKNLGLGAKMPPENAMFYGAIHPGLDFWQSSFFCGSAALLRRAALNEAGGFAGDSITEDAETAMLLHSKGWRSLYWDQPLVAGLQPDTFTSFIIQRMRWAQGMMQIFRLHNPLGLSGLKPWQRLAYLSNMLFWLFPLARVVYLLAPLCFLVFDLRIYDATPTEIGAYALPYLVASKLEAHYLFGRWRWPLVSDIYETMQSLFSLPAVLRALKNPRSPRFQVTPKLERLEEDFISPLAMPFYGLTALLLAGAIWGSVRLWHESDTEKAMLLLIGLLWLAINLAVVLAALGALLERRQRRRSQRIKVDLTAEWRGAGVNIPLRLTDVSLGGAQGVCPLEAFHLPQSREGDLRLRQPFGPCAFRTRIVNWRRHRGHYVLGLAFVDTSPQEYRQRVLLVYGDSRRWARLFREQHGYSGLIGATARLLAAGFFHAVRHFLWLSVHLLRRGTRGAVDGQGAEELAWSSRKNNGIDKLAA